MSLAEIKGLYEECENYKVKVVLSDKAKKLFEQVKAQDKSPVDFELNDILYGEDKVLMKTIYQHFMSPINVVQNGTVYKAEGTEGAWALKGQVLEDAYFMFKTSLHAKCVGVMVEGFLKKHNKYVDLWSNLNEQMKSCVEEGIDAFKEKGVRSPALLCRSEDVYWLSVNVTKTVLDLKGAVENLSVKMENIRENIVEKDASSQSKYQFTKNSIFLIATLYSFYVIFCCKKPNLLDISYIQHGFAGGGTIFLIALMADLYCRK